MSRVSDFLKDNGMTADAFDQKSVEEAFLRDMTEKKSLRMIPSYQKSSKEEIPKYPVLAIDAGGSNLRFALIDHGEIQSENRMPMFGLGKEISADMFFDLMAKEIEKYDAEKIGFCFSYPCEIQDNRDGRILTFAKEIKISGAEGKLLGEELNKRLNTKREFSVLNDTVAAQLGVGADAGIILGTGLNICYTDPRLHMIVVSECGQYDEFPLGRFDEMLCKELSSPQNRAEKMISGAYLGKLIEITAREYFGRSMPGFELKDVSEFLIGEGILNDYFESTADRNDFREMVSLLQQRASYYVAMMLKCLLSGYEKGSRVSVALEGSTIYKMPGYHEALANEVSKTEGIDIEFSDARGTLLYGCVRSFL